MAEPLVGSIIYLNRSSSTGKSTLGEAILEGMDEPFVLVGADTIFGGVGRRHSRTVRPGDPDPQVEAGVSWILDHDDRVIEIRFGPFGRRMMYGLHRMVTGLAALLFEQPHRHAIYDLEVDTSAIGPEEAVVKIRAHVEQHQPRAFAEIAARDGQSQAVASSGSGL